MAGYIFTISKNNWDDFINNNLNYGVFSPRTIPYTDKVTPTDTKKKTSEKMSDNKKKRICRTLSAIFGDFVTMKENDNIYFLSDRKIYGIGKAVKIGKDCKYDNYLEASALLPIDEYHSKTLIVHDYLCRWFVCYLPAPHFFKKGADMDDILKYKPNSFKMLRAFEGKSFIKIDDEENMALREFISLTNEPYYQNKEEFIYKFNPQIHKDLEKEDLTDYIMDLEKAIKYKDNFKYVESEMFIESIFMQKLIRKQITFSGSWDYITHQLIASPFKPISYVDWIDIFGYKFSSKYKYKPPLIMKYFLIETKKDKVNQSAVEQTMQYLDWICKEYASGNYSLIDAYVICSSTVRNIHEILSQTCERSYIIESHPAKPKKWNSFKIITYKIDKVFCNVSFELLI